MVKETGPLYGALNFWSISDSYESACGSRTVGTLDSCVSRVFRQFIFISGSYVAHSSGNLLGLRND